MDNKNEILEGFFKKIIYSNNNFLVAVFIDEKDEIVVTGPFFEFDKNNKYKLTGKYVDHYKYGFQFDYEFAEKETPKEKEQIIKFLSSPIFKMIGEKTAEKIYNHFKEDTLFILKENIELLDEVNISEKQKRYIKDGIESILNDNDESIFSLIASGFSNNDAKKIFNKFKKNTLIQFKENPFKFYLDCYGISLNTVCNAADKIEIENVDQKYNEALLVYLFKELSFKKGDIFIEYEELKTLFNKNSNYDFSDILNICVNDEYLIVENNNIYLKEAYNNEYYIANYLINKNNHNATNVDLDYFIEYVENLQSIKFDETQKEAIKKFVENDFSIIIGGPGTGKTTLIKAISMIYNFINVSNDLIVIAPTGRASKRINEICEVQSKTIHSLLRWNKDDNTFIFNEDNPILYDCIIIDEFSMVDNDLFASLLKASNKVKKICIIGDDNQLPSIRQGNVLRDLIDSNIFEKTKLNITHRQKKGNEIIKLANEIISENVNFDNYHKDVKFLDINDFNINVLTSMIKNDIKNGTDISNIQVLSPMYKTAYGIDYLNQNLQNTFNPKNSALNEIILRNTIYRENDRVIQGKNRPDDDVYNGDIGYIEIIDNNSKNITVNYSGTLLFYNFDDINEISLAYAMSVHKAQGSEYRNVYFLFNKSQKQMLNKNMIYTAISRAKNNLILIGDKEVFINSIKKEAIKRKTTLKKRLINLNK